MWFRSVQGQISAGQICVVQISAGSDHVVKICVVQISAGSDQCGSDLCGSDQCRVRSV